MFCFLFLLPGTIFLLIYTWLTTVCLVLWLNAPFSEKLTLTFLSIVVATKLLLQKPCHISIENSLPYFFRQLFYYFSSLHKHPTVLFYDLLVSLRNKSTGKETTSSSYHRIFHLICFCIHTLPFSYYG